jgi:hypothetical protein
MIMLGSNDYTSLPHPTNEQFTQGLVDFINLIIADYDSFLGSEPLHSNTMLAAVKHSRDSGQSSSKILAMCAPGGLPNQCSNIKKATELTNTTCLRIPDVVYVGGFCCDAHPFRKTQQNVANYILPVVKDLLSIT